MLYVVFLYLYTLENRFCISALINFSETMFDYI